MTYFVQVEFVHAVAVGTIVDMLSVHLESLSVLCSPGPGVLGSTSILAQSQSCMLSCKSAETEYGIWKKINMIKMAFYMNWNMKNKNKQWNNLTPQSWFARTILYKA